MELSTCILGFVFACLCLISSPVQAEDICEKRTGCSCVFPNGTGIDLSPATKPTFYSTQIYQEKKNGSQYELSIYYYHPCFDKMPDSFNGSGPNSTCGVPLSICRHRNTMDLANGTYKLTEGNYELMGSSNHTNFSSDGRSIKYDNSPSGTTMMLICADTDDRLEIYSLEDPQHEALAFYSRNACLRQIEEVGRSTGSTLLIIFFCFVIFYLVLGICTKKFLMGATGIEVVPNLAFWSDLPNLVKDGWAFAISGFKLPARGGPGPSPDPNSYDSI